MIYAQIMAVLFICPVNKFISIVSWSWTFISGIYRCRWRDTRHTQKKGYRKLYNNREYYVCIVVTFDIPIFSVIMITVWWIFRLLWCDHGFFHIGWLYGCDVDDFDGNPHYQRDKNLILKSNTRIKFDTNQHQCMR